MIKRIVLELLKLLYIFKVQKDKIFFISFDGTAYGFDSKAMVKYINRNYPNEFKLFWGTKKSELRGYDGSDGLTLVKIKSLKGVFHMMTAGVLIYNINPPSYIPFRKDQLLFNCWHSISYKKVGKYIGEENAEQVNKTTHYFSHALNFSEWVIKDSFLYKGTIVDAGVPRNDIFFDCNEIKNTANKIKKFYSISEKIKIALFAPTFRGDFEYEDEGIDFERLQSVLEDVFGDKWIIMYRMHPMIAEKYNFSHKNTINASLYPDMQDLLCAADIFISDYSGGMWDFSLQKKPVFIFARDIKVYQNERGLYMPCSMLPYPVAMDNDELEQNIRNFDVVDYNQKLSEYFNYMGSYENGNACSHMMKVIIHNL